MWKYIFIIWNFKIIISTYADENYQFLVFYFLKREICVFFLISPIITRKMYWINKNFRISDFDGFTRFMIKIKMYFKCFIIIYISFLKIIATNPKRVRFAEHLVFLIVCAFYVPMFYGNFSSFDYLLLNFRIHWSNSETLCIYYIFYFLFF